MSRLVVVAAVAAVMTTAGQEAWAQASMTQPAAATYLPDCQVWLQDRSMLEGRGIRTGSFELHPAVGLDFGYDSNVFYASSSVPGAQQSALRLRVTPAFYVSSIGQQRSANSDSPTTALPTVNFRGGAGLVYHEWIGLSGTGTRDVSTLRNLGAQASLRFDFFPQRTWQFGLGVDFVRMIQPGASDDIPGGRTLSQNTFDRNSILGNLEIAYAPGRGVFELRFGYNGSFNIFDNLTYNSSMFHQGFARMRWRFLPKTALVWDGAVGSMSYLDASGAGTGLFSSTPMVTRFGLTGLLTNRISLLVLAGYHGTFYDRGDNADTVIGQAELQWLIDPRSRLRGGFLRDVQPSLFGNYFVRNRGYLNYSQSFSGRFLISADAGVGYNQYGYLATSTGARFPGVTGADGADGSFDAVRVDGTLFAEYRFSDVFGINATARGEALLSGVRFPSRGASTGQPIDWTRFDAYLGVRANW